jgi:hypothetical protein
MTLFFSRNKELRNKTFKRQYFVFIGSFILHLNLHISPPKQLNVTPFICQDGASKPENFSPDSRSVRRYLKQRLLKATYMVKCVAGDLNWKVGGNPTVSERHETAKQEGTVTSFGQHMRVCANGQEADRRKQPARNQQILLTEQIRIEKYKVAHLHTCRQQQSNSRLHVVSSSTAGRTGHCGRLQIRYKTRN